VALHGYVVALRAAGIDNIEFVGFDNGSKAAAELPDAVFVTKPGRLRVAPLAMHAMGASLLMGRFLSRQFVDRIQAITAAAKYDVVLFQHAYMAQYLECIKENLSGALKVASSEVLESRAFREKARIAGGFKGRLLMREARILDQAEARAFSGFDRVTFFSEEDRQHYTDCGGKVHAEVINLGLDMSRYELLEPAPKGELKVAFFGSFSWFANVDALEFLISDVWPTVVAAIPTAELHIAGRDAPEWLRSNSALNIFAHGRVDSVRDFLRDKHAVLSPIRIGGGVRLKMLESLAWGRPVISTTAGAEGLESELVSLISLADTPDEFAAVLKSFAKDEATQIRAERGCAIVREKYDARRLCSLFSK